MIRTSAIVALSIVLPCHASADLTVIYAPPAPPGPLVAEVVARAEPEPRRPPRTAREIAREMIESSARGEAPDEAPVAPVVAASRAPEAPREEAPREEAPREEAPHEEAPAARPSEASEARPLVVVRVGDGSREEASLTLLDAEGRPDPASLEALSILARPRDAARPSDEDVRAHREDLSWVATDVMRLHPGLLLRLAQIRARFPGRAIELVSGYRPDARETSRHRVGRALDLRVVGVDVRELDAFLSTLEETGVGLYPTSQFVHVDVRGARAHWIDVSGPGESAR